MHVTTSPLLSLLQSTLERYTYDESHIVRELLSDIEMLRSYKEWAGRRIRCVDRWLCLHGIVVALAWRQAWHRRTLLQCLPLFRVPPRPRAPALASNMPLHCPCRMLLQKVTERDRPLMDEVRDLRGRLAEKEKEMEDLRGERKAQEARLLEFEKALLKLKDATQEEAIQRWNFEKRIRTAEAELQGARLR